ncbi:MAG: hypothetical protein AAB599_02225 [Patescibacteria group bacterium]
MPSMVAGAELLRVQTPEEILHSFTRERVELAVREAVFSSPQDTNIRRREL